MALSVHACVTGEGFLKATEGSSGIVACAPPAKAMSLRRARSLTASALSSLTSSYLSLGFSVQKRRSEQADLVELTHFGLCPRGEVVGFGFRPYSAGRPASANEQSRATAR